MLLKCKSSPLSISVWPILSVTLDNSPKITYVCVCFNFKHPPQYWLMAQKGKHQFSHKTLSICVSFFGLTSFLMDIQPQRHAVWADLLLSLLPTADPNATVPAGLVPGWKERPQLGELGPKSQNACPCILLQDTPEAENGWIEAKHQCRPSADSLSNLQVNVRRDCPIQICVPFQAESGQGCHFQA